MLVLVFSKNWLCPIRAPKCELTLLWVSYFCVPKDCSTFLYPVTKLCEYSNKEDIFIVLC